MEQQFNLQVATLIKADGETKELVPNNGKKFTYKEVRNAIGNYIEELIDLRNAIGNYIELIDLRYYTKDKNYKKMQFICDEEGAINGSDFNEKASQLLKEILGPGAQDLYGNIIFLPKKMF